jgi:hypothetical protein
VVRNGTIWYENKKSPSLPLAVPPPEQKRARRSIETGGQSNGWPGKRVEFRSWKIEIGKPLSFLVPTLCVGMRSPTLRVVPPRSGPDSRAEASPRQLAASRHLPARPRAYRACPPPVICTVFSPRQLSCALLPFLRKTHLQASKGISPCFPVDIYLK